MRIRRAVPVGVAAFLLAACSSPPKYADPPAGSFSAASVSLEIDGAQQTVPGARVGRAFFGATGVRPLLGRVFVPADHDAAARTALLSDALWRRSFGGRPTIIGSQIKANGEAMTIVGILPKDFNAPPGAEIWVPRTEAPAK